MNAEACRDLPLAVWSLWRREVVRFLRQRSRIVGALGTPIVFWLLVGAGFGTSVRTPGQEPSQTFLEYAFPGAIAMITLFTAIFSTISIIEDRTAGFLQGVLVAPVGRPAIAIGKLLGSTTLAVFQGMLFLLLAPLTGLPLTAGSLVATFLVMIVLSLALSGLGFIIAWSLDSTQGFHAVMNLVLMPMWILSGAFFPPSGAATWMRWVMTANPLTYGVAAIRHALYVSSDRPGMSGPAFSTALLLTMAFAALTVGLSIRMANRHA